MNGIVLIGRMLLALGVVLGLMWLLARYARRPLAGRPDKVLSVVARQQLNRTASVAVVKVMDRALVVGISDQGVRLLTEAELAPIEMALASERTNPSRQIGRARGAIAKPAEQPTAAADLTAAPERRGALDGSILSPATWRQLVGLARDATVRR
ncbi:MAG: flagellar protein FliO/FliZ [Mycobacterium sp.]|nr:flagellar protein FliO/FliZ [Mycobacterium sp.]